MAKQNKEKEPETCASCDEYKEGWKRALADYENLQRDLAERSEESRKRIKADFAQSLLPVIDNFTQAVVHAPDLPDHQAWLDGVLYIQKQFEESLNELGVTKIPTDGLFDPSLHEAAGSETHADKEDQTILREVQPGWQLGETVLRSAKVIINSLDETK